MRLFCFKDHSERPSYKTKLLMAKAELARAKKLPIIAFPPVFGSHGLGITQHSVDVKAERLAYLEADVAQLEVLAGEAPVIDNQDKESDNARR